MVDRVALLSEDVLKEPRESDELEGLGFWGLGLIGFIGFSRGLIGFRVERV